MWPRRKAKQITVDSRSFFHAGQIHGRNQTIINTLNVQNVYSYDIHVKVFFRAKTGAFQMEAFTQDCLEAKKNTKEKLSMIADSEEEEGLISLHLCII